MGVVERQVASGLAEVEAAADGTFVLRVDGSLQSQVDLADPTQLRFEYVRRIGDVLDLVAARRQPVSVLHIGGAGLTLPRYVAATRPRSRQIVLEPDEDLTEFVRETLPVPKRAGIKVRGTTGRAGIAEVYDDSVDAVVVDAFVREAVPANLVTAEFVAQCLRVLRPAGVAVFNLIDGSAGLGLRPPGGCHPAGRVRRRRGAWPSGRCCAGRASATWCWWRARQLVLTSPPPGARPSRRTTWWGCASWRGRRSR